MIHKQVGIRKLLVVVLLNIAVFTPATGQEDLPCLAMAQSTPFDQFLENGHSLLSGYTPEDCACFGEYFARKHIAEGRMALLDSEWVPIFELKGYSHCRLADYDYAYKIIPDLFLPADDRPKARAYIERYNALMLYELRRIAGEDNYEDIFHPPDMLDPYVLRERLHKLSRFGQITRSEWIDDRQIRIRLDLKPLYRNLNIDWRKLQFEIIDENNPDNPYLLSLEELDRDGFSLVINSKSRKSNVWFDFKIRVDYSGLSDNGVLFTCDRINEFLYRYDHLSLTKDLRLITHLH